MWHLPLQTLRRHPEMALLLMLACSGVRAEGEPFVDNAKFGAQLRSLNFRRDLPADVEQETWAAGGWLWGRTGYWRDFLQFGGTVYGAFRLHGPEDKDGAGLLRPGQDGYAVIGEAYARLKAGEQTATIFRQVIGANPVPSRGLRSITTDSSYLAPSDIRMSPLTYEAVMFNGKITDALGYQAGYVDKVKGRNSEQFVSMSQFAGVSTKRAGMWTGGLQWQPIKDLWLEGSYYTIEDTLRIAYANVDWVNRVSKDTHYRLAAQVTNQRSAGDDRLTGDSFSTWNGGVYGEYRWNWLTLYTAFSTTGKDQQIRNPFSDGPLYLTKRIKTYSRAGEDAVNLGSTFNLATLGLAGFSFDVNYTTDTQRPPHSPTGAFQPKWREVDTDFVYRFPKESVVSNMQLRARWARLREDYGGYNTHINDLRFDLNWAVPFN